MHLKFQNSLMSAVIEYTEMVRDEITGKERVVLNVENKVEDVTNVLVTMARGSTRSEEVNEINKFFENKDEYKYSVLGTVTAYFNKPHKREYYYFCSQFVAELLINSGIYRTDKLPEVIKPMDLLEIENKTLFYEGFINEDRATRNSFTVFNSQRISRVISRLIS